MLEDFEFTVGHKIVEHKHHGVHAILLTDEPYSGIIFSYGKVEFTNDGEPDENGDAHLKFDYEIHEIPENYESHDPDAFEKYIGDFLLELIMNGIKNNDISYTGGIDENRIGDNFQSDSE